jgi:hypothetical protein
MSEGTRRPPLATIWQKAAMPGSGLVDHGLGRQAAGPIAAGARDVGAAR